MELWLNYQQPRRYKEERTAYQAYGNKERLFIPVFAETDFNFYRNMVWLPGIADAPVISPLSTTAILSYKYELVGSKYDNGRLISEIKVIPRKAGNSTVSGTLWIVEEEWTIHQLRLELPVGTLLFADQFLIEQSYTQQGDSLWIMDRQAFHYRSRQGNKQLFQGSTVLRYSDYSHTPPFPADFFGNEVAVTTTDAYQRDGDYWAQSRTEALADREAQLIHLRDSIQRVHNSPEFRDSLERLFNRVNLLEIAWEGVAFQNWREKTRFYVGSLAGLIDFSPVGGWRVGPYLSYFKRYESGHILSNAGSLNVGLKNGDFQGNFSSWYRYDPFRLGDISLSGGRSFESINAYDAYLNLLRPSNYILKDALRANHRIELFNGFFLTTNVEMNDRHPITGYDTGSFIGEVVEDEDDCSPSNATKPCSRPTSSATPRPTVHARTQPQKSFSAAKWPTFSLMHHRGWTKPSAAISASIT
ncbi:MAG: DUF5686 family protein [Saprospiraceae bacterium]